MLIDEPPKPSLTVVKSITSIVQELPGDKKEDSNKKPLSKEQHEFADYKLEMLLHTFKDELLLNKLSLCVEHFELLCLQHPSFGSRRIQIK